MLRDFTYAARTLAKSPVFSPPPPSSPSRWASAPARPSSASPTPCCCGRFLTRIRTGWFSPFPDMRKRNVKDFPFSNADFIDLRNGAAGHVRRTWEQVNSGPRDGAARGSSSPEQIRWAAVTPNFFRMMGARIALGRDFTDADGQPRNRAGGRASRGRSPGRMVGPELRILAAALWREHGHRRPMPGHAGGQGRHASRGVLKPGFELLFPPDANMEQRPDVWFARASGLR
jgi:hypothetical protein